MDRRGRFGSAGVCLVAATIPASGRRRSYKWIYGAVGRAQQFMICPCSSGAMLETGMDEETFNLSIRSFLKMVGVNSQRQIEQAVAKAIASGEIRGSERLAATMNLRIAALKLDVQFDGDIKLE